MRSYAFVVLFMIVACRGVSPAWADGPVSVTPEEVKLAAIVAEVRSATRAYLEVEQAKRDGYVQSTGLVPAHGIHFHKALASAFVVTQPPILLYAKHGDQLVLAGVEYVVYRKQTESPFPNAQWTYHEASCHYEDGGEVAASAFYQCANPHPKSGAKLAGWHPEFWFVHLWAWMPNPRGLFAEINPLVGTDTVLAATFSDAPSRAFSEASHHLMGGSVIVVALLAMMQGASVPLGIRGVWPGLLIAAGVWLMLRSDQAWIDQGFTLGSLADPELFQHKLLALITIVLGLIELLRIIGSLRHPFFKMVFPSACLIGGFMMFFHAALHPFGPAFVRHIIQGVNILAVGLVRIFVDQGLLNGRMTKLGWQLLILVLGVQLLIYSE